MSIFVPRIPKNVLSTNSLRYFSKNDSNLIKQFLEFKSLQINEVNHEDKILHQVLSRLDDEEITFALKIIEFIESIKSKDQYGGAREIIEFKTENGKVIVKSIKRNNFLYYILNIFIVLITYTFISYLFKNTLKLQKDLIESQIKQIATELNTQSDELRQMNDYISKLQQISTAKLIEPFILEEKDDIVLPFSYTNDENNIINLLQNFYTQIKLYTNFHPEKHLPDIGNLIQSYEVSKNELASLTLEKSGIINSMLNVLNKADETQQKLILLEQIVKLFPTLIASYSLKVTRVATGTANVHSLIYSLLFRLFIMVAISKFVHKQGNKVIKSLTDTTESRTVSQHKDIIETKENKQIEEIINILNKLFEKSNLDISDKEMITEDILNQLDELIETPNLKKAVKNAVENAVENLPQEGTLVIKNEEEKNGGKPRRKTRRKIRRNKKTKTKKRKPNKKTKKRKIKRKTKVNRKKSKKRRTKK